jgi:hypothetical protein
MATATPSGAATPARWTKDTLSAFLVAELNAHDPGVALSDLERITGSEPYVNDFCHPIAHDLGHAALKKYHGDFAKASSYANDVCGSGYLHGIVEETLDQSPDKEAAVTTICGPRPTGACLHGVGHGAMFIAKLDVPKAEQLCSLFRNSYRTARCAEGIFMQLFEPDEDDPAALSKLPARKLAAEPLYPCPQQPSLFQSACYFYAPIYYLQTHDYVDHPESFGQALDWCLSAPSAAGRSDCTRGTGSRLMKYNLDRPVWDAAQCEAAPTSGQRGDCIAGMVSYWDVNYNDRSVRVRLCPQLAGVARSDCIDAVNVSDSAD